LQIKKISLFLIFSKFFSACDDLSSKKIFMTLGFGEIFYAILICAEKFLRKFLLQDGVRTEIFRQKMIMTAFTGRSLVFS